NTEEALSEEARTVRTDSAVCASCGGDNPATNKFCAKCGVSLQQVATQSEPMKEAAEGSRIFVPKPVSTPEPSAPGQHYYHHHYHHHYFSPASEVSPIPGADARVVQNSAVRDTRARCAVGTSALRRPESAVRKMTDDG